MIASLWQERTSHADEEISEYIFAPNVLLIHPIETNTALLLSLR